MLKRLRGACEEAGAILRCGWGVTGIRREEGGFRLENSQGEVLWAARCVLACGGKASPKHSFSEGGYRLAQGLGHRVTSLRPSLTGLQSPKKCLRSLKGMRVRQRLPAAPGEVLRKEKGEVLFGERGLSGICVFDLSAYLPEGCRDGEAALDLLEELSYREVLAF